MVTPFFHLRCKGIRFLLNIEKSSLVKVSRQSIIKMASSTIPLSNIPKVDIDNSGIFKYILIKVYNEKNEDETPVTIVRGYGRCNYHSDIYDEVQEKLAPFDCEVLGGGRMAHDSDLKRIQIYGYSQGYGKADHEVAANIIKDVYPSYSITVSDEGY